MKLILKRFTLTRTLFGADGAFGRLVDAGGDQLAVTLEHAYVSGQDPLLWLTKVPAGLYTCTRGIYHPGGKRLETFEVQNVPNHDGILFHMGNVAKDSDGCILLGQQIVRLGASPDKSITASKKTFESFMELLNGQDSFTLEVR